MRSSAARHRWIVGGSLLLAGTALALARARRRQERDSVYRFDAAYREIIRLKDGTYVRLRLVRPTDRELLASEVRRASSEARYQRFHAAKADLSAAELRYFTEVDGVNHFALGALRGWGARREGLGVARFIRLPARPDTAEAALAVAERAQRLGLGRALLTRLLDAARERGIRTIRMEVLAANLPMRALLAATLPDAAPFPDGNIILYEVRL